MGHNKQQCKHFFRSYNDEETSCNSVLSCTSRWHTAMALLQALRKLLFTPAACAVVHSRRYYMLLCGSNFSSPQLIKL